MDSGKQVQEMHPWVRSQKSEDDGSWWLSLTSGSLPGPLFILRADAVSAQHNSISQVSTRSSIMVFAECQDAERKLTLPWVTGLRRDDILTCGNSGQNLVTESNARKT